MLRSLRGSAFFLCGLLNCEALLLLLESMECQGTQSLFERGSDALFTSEGAEGGKYGRRVLTMGCFTQLNEKHRAPSPPPPPSLPISTESIARVSGLSSECSFMLSQSVIFFFFEQPYTYFVAPEPCRASGTQGSEASARTRRLEPLTSEPLL